MMVVYGYARLVGYTPQLELEPDILESVESDGDRVFTFKLRQATAGPTASPSPPRISATTGRTSPTTSSLRRPGRRRT